MIIKCSPSEVEWVTGPLPSPELIHSECEIVVWFRDIYHGETKITFIKSKPRECFSLRLGTYTKYVWEDKDYLFSDYNKIIQCWGWWKHFGKL